MLKFRIFLRAVSIFAVLVINRLDLLPYLAGIYPEDIEAVRGCLP